MLHLPIGTETRVNAGMAEYGFMVEHVDFGKRVCCLLFRL